MLSRVKIVMTAVVRPKEPFAGQRRYPIGSQFRTTASVAHLASAAILCRRRGRKLSLNGTTVVKINDVCLWSASVRREKIPEQETEEFDDLRKGDDRDADPDAELATDVGDELVGLVVGGLLGLDDVAVGHVDVQPGEVLHGRFTVLVLEVLPHRVVLDRVVEALTEVLDVEYVEVRGVALVAGGRPL